MTAGPSVGQRFAIAEGETRIGRATHCDWVIGSASISRKHATIELLSDGCWIRDEGANNGTFVEGERIRRRRLETGILFDWERLSFALRATYRVCEALKRRRERSQ